MFETNLNRITINNIKTKIEIVVVSKNEFSIIVAIDNKINVYN